MRQVAWTQATGYATALMLLPFLAAVLLRPRASDDALVRRIAEGDAPALRELYDRCAQVALSVAQRILRNPAEAEDVLQEAFVEAWRNADRFDARRGSAMAWLVAIARSRALDRLRSRAAAERARTAMQAEGSAPSPQPLESAEQRQGRDRLQAALAELPQDQRSTLQLAYFEGLTQTEIAARTGEPLGTVKTRCRLALEKLSRMLAEGGT